MLVYIMDCTANDSEQNSVRNFLLLFQSAVPETGYFHIKKNSDLYFREKFISLLHDIKISGTGFERTTFPTQVSMLGTKYSWYSMNMLLIQNHINISQDLQNIAYKTSLLFQAYYKFCIHIHVFSFYCSSLKIISTFVTSRHQSSLIRTYRARNG